MWNFLQKAPVVNVNLHVQASNGIPWHRTDVPEPPWYKEEREEKL